MFRYENVSSNTRYYRRNSLGIFFHDIEAFFFFLPIPRQKSCMSCSDSSKVSAEIDWWYQKRYQAKSMGTTSLDEFLHFLLGNTFLYLRSKIWQRNTTLINSIKMKLHSQPLVSSSSSLQFLAFDTEASHDILKVWDGPPDNEMSLKEVSGSLLPEGIHSTLNIVTIQFETDFYITKSGFAIDFSSK